MKLISTNELNDLDAAFQKDALDGQDFQSFVEASMDKYGQGSYRQSYIAPRLSDYTQRFSPRYEGAPTAETMKASDFVYQVEQDALRKMAQKKARENYYLSLTTASQETAEKQCRKRADDWTRFFYKPVVIYSSHREQTKTGESRRGRFELVELKNSGTHREFLIREAGTGRFVEWKDLSDVNAVRECLHGHGFPEDECYSREDFLNEVKNGRGKILLCVKKRATAEFILNLCHALLHRSESYSNHCKEVDKEWMKIYRRN